MREGVERSSGRGVFISHTHSDARIAQALDGALKDLFGNRIEVAYSTKLGPGGVDAGVRWYEWIGEQIQSAEVTFVLLTPAALQSNWIPWEAGAVYGAALTGAPKTVLPLRFGVTNDQLASTFQPIQTRDGLDEREFTAVLDQLLALMDDVLTPHQTFDAARRSGVIVTRYLEAARAGLDESVVVVTEAALDDWCRRLDDLSERRQAIDVEDLHECLNVAFGRTNAHMSGPLDLRIHRRLGELYLDTRSFRLAVGEYKLALQLAPRDIMLMRALGQAMLECRDDISELLDTIEKLDPQAFERNVDCAALKGRVERSHENFSGARHVYRAALRCHPNHFYLHELLGRVEFADGKDKAARDAFRNALRLATGMPQQTVWTHATAAVAQAALDEEELALAEVQVLRKLGPTERQRATVEKGFTELGGLMDLPATRLAPMIDELYGRRDPGPEAPTVAVS